MRAGRKFFGSGASVGGSSSPLLFDSFAGNGAVSGRSPSVGPKWATTGPNAADMATLSGEMYQSAGAGAGYATAATGARIGEVGCKFRLTAVSTAVVLGGTPGAGKTVGANIYPSGDPNFTQISYTLTGGDTLATAATAWAAAITANAAMIAAGISATANSATVTFVSTRPPRVDQFTVGGGITASTLQSVTPTLSSYPTGADFSQTMVHFRLGVDGYCDWTIFEGGLTLMQSLTAKRIGLQANTEYTYRCCIAAPYVWGGIWQGSTLLGCAVGQDTRIAASAGASCFFETTGANVLFFNEAWAYRSPSISRAAILAAMA